MENGFGGFLRQKRQEKKLTQKELAKLLFVSESAVSKWENNIARPDIILLPKLSDVLEVSEHELITASIDEGARKEKMQAKKWRAFSMSWNLFFYIAYGVALLTCFICNLAINRTLSWFWIVAAALLLGFTFTNLPQFINKNKLIFVPFSMYLALCILLVVCAIYTQGDWFWVASLSVLLGLIIIFTPIYIAKYPMFSKIKKYNDFVSVAVDFLLLNILLIVIDASYGTNHWYIKFALPIVFAVYIVLNLLLSIRFLKTNRFLKTSAVLLLCNFFTYIVPQFVRVDNTSVQQELNDLNIFKANFSIWRGETIETNVHCIVFLTASVLAVVFFVVGLIRHYKRKKSNN